jgi:putative redox protein
MNVHLKLDRNMRLIATNALGQETPFDATPDIGGENSAPTPMQVLLQSMVACTMMDILSILRKRRKQIDDLQVEVSSTRAESHPKVFTHVTMNFHLTSPDADSEDLTRALELSHKNYCSASAMFQRSGCTVEWTAVVEKG